MTEEQKKKHDFQVMVNFLKIRKILPKNQISVIDGYDLKNNTVCIYYNQNYRQWETFYYKDNEKIDLKRFRTNADCIPYFYKMLFKYFPDTENIIKGKSLLRK